MRKHSSPARPATAHRAASGLRHLLDEAQVLMLAVPDLHDAFDADDLPLAFILRRDSQVDAVGPPDTTAPRASHVDRRPTRAVPARRRGGPRKQMSGE
jgi:hypothetical protein